MHAVRAFRSGLFCVAAALDQRGLRARSSCCKLMDPPDPHDIEREENPAKGIGAVAGSGRLNTPPPRTPAWPLAT